MVYYSIDLHWSITRIQVSACKHWETRLCVFVQAEMDPTALLSSIFASSVQGGEVARVTEVDVTRIAEQVQSARVHNMFL